VVPAGVIFLKGSGGNIRVKIIDLTHPIHSEMPVYPGTEGPNVSAGWTIEKDGFRESRIHMCTHTGTHVDAPAHIIRGAKSLDQVPMDRFIGKSVVIDLTQSIGKTIDISDLMRHESRIRNSDFVLLHTGWHRFWGNSCYFEDYPVLTQQAAEWLCDMNLKGIGVDMISVDACHTTEFLIHNILLEHQLIIIENLTNLDALPGPDFIFSCFPLYLDQADGSPVRAVGFKLE